MRAETTARASHPFAKKFFALVATGRGILPSGSKRVALNVCYNGSGGRGTTQDATAHYGACKVPTHDGYLCKTGLGRNANCQRTIGKLNRKRGKIRETSTTKPPMF